MSFMEEENGDTIESKIILDSCVRFQQLFEERLGDDTLKNSVLFYSRDIDERCVNSWKARSDVSITGLTLYKIATVLYTSRYLSANRCRSSSVMKSRSLFLDI